MLRVNRSFVNAISMAVLVTYAFTNYGEAGLFSRRGSQKQNGASARPSRATNYRPSSVSSQTKSKRGLFNRNRTAPAYNGIGDYYYSPPDNNANGVWDSLEWN